MEIIINLKFILCIISIFLINIINAENGIKHKEFENKDSNIDKFYMVFVNNTSNDGVHNSSDHIKRQNIEELINSVIVDIHNLIIENMDTYENLSKLQEMENQNIQLKKRDNQIQYLMDNGDSSYVYPISSVKDTTVLYTYLSPSLAKTVESMPNVYACESDSTFKFTSYYNEEEIQAETNWKTINIRKNSDLHLSLISQGKYNENLVQKYDTNYYFPESAGEDIDLFIIDSGFNFDYQEYYNDNNRIVRCGYNITEGRVLNMASQTNCNISKPNDHGARVADVAAGSTHGVANKANVYGFMLNNQSDGLVLADIIGGLQYIRDNLFRSYKAVFNLSLGEFFPIDVNNEAINYLQKLINEISSEGAVFVAAAGNEYSEVYNTKDNMAFYPCVYDNVICVGGIDNIGINDITNPTYNQVNSNTMNSSNYKKAKLSNFGNRVNIYAPFYASVLFKNSNTNVLNQGIDSGTSIASPIVAGVIATLMSEYSDMGFNSEKMLIFLNKLGVKNAINNLTEEDNNIFINNGKHTVYSQNSKYNGCGVQAGNQKCTDACCTIDGQCSTDEDSCRTDHGCQVIYGLYIPIVSETNRCGYGYGICSPGYCCSYDGYCGKSINYCGAGCQIDYGLCNRKMIF